MNNNVNTAEELAPVIPITEAQEVVHPGALNKVLRWVGKRAGKVLVGLGIIGLAGAGAAGCKKSDAQKCLGDEQGTELTDDLNSRAKRCRGALETLSNDRGSADKRARAQSLCFGYGNTLKSQRERARFAENAAASAGKKKKEKACRALRTNINGRIVVYESDLHPKAIWVDPR